ncbi:zonular occludens toxin domain-containing protein [Sulfurimonas sp.]|uniref:zonular occludens toxin domain-containing protein n=1 Tax=Sulfurimonas sp. TaxID=2022749 RepID=UPI0026102368|nr:zonular occludens toxin domain-containing protein [Sulfurimonas sp.]MDD3855270.1 zonular occludens toxin domain-containing protein [Sulfurimonas sp.]
MISFFTGVPGSGKSCYAVDKIFNNFSDDVEAKKDKKATYTNCYTNINEFKFDKVHDVFPLDFDELKKHLTTLHKYYKDKKDDEFLIEKCKEYNIYNTLFIVDEAHNFFDTRDTVLIWWLSYHRHLFHEIILITQNLALIESKYKSFSEFFYKAFPQSLTLFKTHFKYNVYCSSRMSLVSKSGSIKIKRNKKVFELYKSGDSINAQNIILKFIFISLFFFVAAAAIFFWFISSKNASVSAPDSLTDNNISKAADSSTRTSSHQTSQIPNGPAQIKNDNVVYLGKDSDKYRDAKFIAFSCNTSICYNQTFSLPVPLVTQFIKSNNMNLLYSQNINKNYIKLFISCSEDFYIFLNSISNQGSDTHEEKSLVNGFFNTAPAPITQGR